VLGFLLCLKPGRVESQAALPAVHLSVDATKALRSVDARWFGVNTAIWDSNFDTPQTVSLLEEMGTRVLRGPGGSLADQYHWATGTTLTNTWRWANSFGNFTHVAARIGAQTFITVNYGTGSANEAAAWVAYANGSTTNLMPLGVDSSGKNWDTASYWASLRAAAPLPHDDSRNFLRISRAAPLAFAYWEIGNECYGTWETDSNAFPHDAYTYAIRARDYFQQMKAVDPAIKIGVVVAPGEDSYSNGHTSHPALNPRTGQIHHGWTPVLLMTLQSLGVTPDFVIHHRYPEFTDKNNPAGSDSDAFLLQCSTQWAVDAADLRQQIKDYFGPGGVNIEMVCTENNSDAGAQGKQSTSLVNGLYYADSLAQLMQTEFNAFVWWDLRNGTDKTGWFDSLLYGWRNYGDLGMINGLTIRHPTFNAAKLMQYFAQPGDTILPAFSDHPLLSAYAARRANGALSLLVLNKDPDSTLSGAMALNGFAPFPAALVRSYGIPQDDAVRTNGPASTQDIATNTLTGAASIFTASFPPLSATLLTLPPAAPRLSIVPPTRADEQAQLQLQGCPAARYVIQNSSDLFTWSTVSTNTLSTSTLILTNLVPARADISFWRAFWQP
jgi:alpha-L-arabinofuranosidase